MPEEPPEEPPAEEAAEAVEGEVRGSSCMAERNAVGTPILASLAPHADFVTKIGGSPSRIGHSHESLACMDSFWRVSIAWGMLAAVLAWSKGCVVPILCRDIVITMAPQNTETEKRLSEQETYRWRR